MELAISCVTFAFAAGSVLAFIGWGGWPSEPTKRIPEVAPAVEPAAAPPSVQAPTVTLGGSHV